jgi:hypothetical protein
VPVRQFSFTDWNVNNPTTPPPGDRLDGEYDRSNQGVNDVITWLGAAISTDGSLRAATVGQAQLVPGLFDHIADDAIAEVQPLVDEAQSYAGSALGSASQAGSSASAAASSANAAGGSASTASDAVTTTTQNVSASRAAMITAQFAAQSADNSANSATGDAALSQDYADVCAAWAEYMPDTIPPNILAVMGITGDHWSSRWWANRTIQHGNDVVESIERYYLGAFPIPPTSDSQGNPISTGALYYDLTLGAMYVWNGTAWQPASKPSPTETYRTIWVATAGQTVFSGGDRDGKPLVYNPASNQSIAVFKQGLVLTPPQDYTAAINQVTLTTPAAVGNIVQIWVENVPTIKLDWRTARLDTTGWVFDGLQTSFILRDAQGATLVLSSASDLLLSIDGTWQQAFADYTVSSSTVVFPVAPTSDVRAFGIAIVPVPDVPTPQPGVTAIDTSSWVFDGIQSTFPVLDLTQTPVVPVAPENLLLSLNGVWQAAALDYSVAGSTVTFSAPPEPDAKAFGVVGLPAFVP